MSYGEEMRHVKYETWNFPSERLRGRRGGRRTWQ